ncbi:MAG: tryptophan-rich sensory protein [Gemmatimonadaceae bacterium]
MTVARWKLVNLVTLVVVIALNGLAASGGMSGQSIGAIANQYSSLFLPANYVFGIWSLIYLGQFVAAGYQLLRGDGSAQYIERLGPWWLVAGVLNVAWISLFSFAQFALALVVMLVFLVSLIIVTERLRTPASGPPPRRSVVERAVRGAVERWPFDIYLAWISVAVIANTFQFAHVVNFGGFGIPEATWSVSMMGVATLLGLLMAFRRGNWLFPMVVAWAVRGIGARFIDLPAIASVTVWLAPVGAALGLVLWFLGRSHRRRQVFPE